MCLHSRRAPCTTPGGHGRLWKYIEALVMTTGVTGRFACGFQSDLHFADVLLYLPTLIVIPCSVILTQLYHTYITLLYL